MVMSMGDKNEIIDHWKNCHGATAFRICGVTVSGLRVVSFAMGLGFILLQLKDW